MANGGGGNVFFIPPEFYGLSGLGKGLQQASQQMEQQRAQRERERLAEEEMEQQERLEKKRREAEKQRHKDRMKLEGKREQRADRSSRIQEGLMMAEALNLDGSGRLRMIQDFAPVGVQPRETQEEYLTRVARETLENFDDPDLPDWKRRIANRWATGDAFADVREEALKTETTGRQLQNRLTEIGLDEARSLRDATTEYYESVGQGHLAGTGFAGIEFLQAIDNLEMSDIQKQEIKARVNSINQSILQSAAQTGLIEAQAEIAEIQAGALPAQVAMDQLLDKAQLRAMDAEVGLTVAQTDLTRRELEERERAVQMLLERERAVSLNMYTGGAVPTDTLMDYVIAPENVTGPYREMLDEANTAFVADTKRTAELRLEKLEQENNPLLHTLQTQIEMAKVVDRDTPPNLVGNMQETFTAFMEQQFPGVFTPAVRRRFWFDDPADFNFEAIINPTAREFARQTVADAGSDVDDSTFDPAYVRQQADAAKERVGGDAAVALARIEEHEIPPDAEGYESLSRLQTQIAEALRAELGIEGSGGLTESAPPAGSALEEYARLIQELNRLREGVTGTSSEISAHRRDEWDAIAELGKLYDQLNPAEQRQADVMREGVRR